MKVEARDGSFRLLVSQSLSVAIERVEAAEQLALERLAEANAACVKAEAAEKRATEAEANLCIAKIAAGEMDKRIAQLEAELVERDSGGERRLLSALRDYQAKVCCYGTKEGDGRHCDCKYSSPNYVKSSEQTGCPEARDLIRKLALSAAAVEVGGE